MATGRIGTTPVLQVRWSKAPSAGTTSLSGLDDNSVSLVYSVGYEAVYRNGVLLSRTNDYTATDGTTITLIDATIAGDIIEVFANQTIPLADTYSQTVANGKFINNTLTTTTGDIIYASAANTPARLGIGSTDQVLKVSGGIPAWGAAPAASFAGCRLTKSATQTITYNTITALTWDVETFDSDAYHSTVTNTSRITIPSGKAGKYLIETACAWLDNSSTGMKYISFRKNNTIFAFFEQSGQATTGQQPQLLTSTVDCAVNDYIEVFVYTAAAGNSSVQGDPYNAGASHFSASFLGA